MGALLTATDKGCDAGTGCCSGSAAVTGAAAPLTVLGLVTEVEAILLHTEQAFSC